MNRQAPPREQPQEGVLSLLSVGALPIHDVFVTFIITITGSLVWRDIQVLILIYISHTTKYVKQTDYIQQCRPNYIGIVEM